MIHENVPPAIWFPTIRTGSGSHVFTERLVAGLLQRGIRATITWLPHRAEYAPWTVRAPRPPPWATIAHVSTWLHPRFLPRALPLVATVHHSVHDPALAHLKGALRHAYHRYWIKPFERDVLKQAATVTAVSVYAANIARQTLSDRPLHVVYNGVDIESFAYAPRTPHPVFRLLYVGKWSVLKGTDLLPSIMRALGDRFELLYTGPSSTKSPANMPPNTRNIGRLPGASAVAAAMHDADALLFPTRNEGFGLVAAEAMACGLPVLATNASAMPELVEDGVTGILCPQDDIGAFVSAALRLHHDPSLRAAMSAAARQRAVDRFSLDTMIDHYIRLYARHTHG